MPSPSLIILVILFLIAALVVPYFVNKKKNKVYLEIINCIENNDDENFNRIIEDKMTRFLFVPYQIEYIKLNKAIVSAKPKEIDAAFEVFDKRRLNNKQKEDIYMKGFNYYISTENKDKAKKYHDLIQGLDNEQMKKETNIVYDTYILKGYQYLDEIIAETEDLEDTYKGVNEFMISKMYENKGDSKMAKEYLAKAQEHMKLLDKQIAKKHKEEEKKKK